jgi:imidazolonepropionase-like amidohydrolase
MRRAALLSLLLAPLVASRFVPAQDRPVVFADISVIDATGSPARPHRTVTVRDGKIADIEEYRPGGAPKTAEVIDGSGKFLIPGLWDMHVHWYDERFLPLFLANGVTGVRQMWGMDVHQRWRRRMQEGSLVGPREIIASGIIDGPKPVWPNSIAVKDAAEGEAAVRNSRRNGADFIKVYSLLPRDAYFAIAAASKREGIPFAGHVTFAVSLSEASDAGQKSIEHLSGVLLAASSREDEFRKELVEAMARDNPFAATGAIGQRRARELRESYDPAKAAALYRRLARNHTWQAPTLTVLRAMANLDDPTFIDDPRLKYVPASMRQMWDPRSDFRLKQRTKEDWNQARQTYDLYVKVVGEMRREGVQILAGTDVLNPFCFPGFSLHDELALLNGAGLTPMEAIQAATRGAADYLGILDSSGTVQKGKTADLVVLDANPLDDIRDTRKIAGVMLGGRYFPRSSLEKMLADVEAVARRPER